MNHVMNLIWLSPSEKPKKSSTLSLKSNLNSEKAPFNRTVTKLPAQRPQSYTPYPSPSHQLSIERVWQCGKLPKTARFESESPSGRVLALAECLRLQTALHTLSGIRRKPSTWKHKQLLSKCYSVAEQFRLVRNWFFSQNSHYYQEIDSLLS